MKDFFKYLTVGEEDKKWGLFLTVVGKARIDSWSLYPSTDHPTGGQPVCIETSGIAKKLTPDSTSQAL